MTWRLQRLIVMNALWMCPNMMPVASSNFGEIVSVVRHFDECNVMEYGLEPGLITVKGVIVTVRGSVWEGSNGSRVPKRRSLKYCVTVSGSDAKVAGRAPLPR